MKRVYILFKIPCFLLLVAAMLTACNEDLKMDVVNNEPPVITDFTPKTGKVGTEITVTGENLHEVSTVLIGGEEATLKYKIDSKSLVVVVNGDCKPGVVTAKNPYGEGVSSASFSISYPTPSIATFAAEGQPNDELYIEGAELDVVLDVLFNNVSATIISQTAASMVVKVPWFPGSTTKIALVYTDGTERKQVLSTGSFLLETPTVTVTGCPTEAQVGSSFEVTGSNLDAVEAAWFGETQASIIQQTSASMTIVIPTFEEDIILPFLLEYYGEKHEVVADFSLTTAPPVLIHYWEDVTTYCQDQSNTENFFDAKLGVVYSPCDYERVKTEITFFTSISAASFQLNNPNNSANQTRNFRCEGVQLPQEVMPNIVRFRTLDPSIPAQDYYIQAVKDKTLEVITQQMIEDDGIPNAGTSGIRFRQPEVAFATNTFTVGDVLMFQQTEAGVITKVGFIEVVTVNFLDGTPDVNKSSWTFNCYFQK